MYMEHEYYLRRAIESATSLWTGLSDTLYTIPKRKTGGRLHFFVMLLGTWCLNYRMVLSKREVETTGNLNEFLPFSVFLCQNLQEIIVIKEKKGYNRAEQNYEVE